MSGATPSPGTLAEQAAAADRTLWNHETVKDHLISFYRQYAAEPRQHTGADLWEDFQEYFSSWTATHFSFAGLHIANNFCIALRESFVYVPRKGDPYTRLAAILDEDEPAEWPTGELARVRERTSAGSSNSSDITTVPYHLQTPTPGGPLLNNSTTPAQTPPAQRLPGAYTSTNLFSSIVQPQTPGNPFYPTLPAPAPAPSTSAPQTANPTPPVQPNTSAEHIQSLIDDITRQSLQDDTTAKGPAQKTRFAEQNEYIDPYRASTAWDPQRTKTIALMNVSKAYSEQMKYKGPEDDFDQKLEEFYEQCNNAGLQPEFRSQAFTYMLTGEAKDHYAYNIRNQISDINGMVESMRKAFGNNEAKQANQTEWNTITIESISRQRKEQKLPVDRISCLNALVLRIQHLYNGLPAFKNTVRNRDEELKNKLLTACDREEACAYATLNPKDSYQEVVSQLRTSIIKFEKINPPTSSRRPHQSYVLDASNDGFYIPPTDEHEQYSVDRIYHGKNGAPTKSWSKKKRCFVCKKENCWSTHHTPEERAKELKAFRSRTYDRTGKRFTDPQIRQFLFEHEGREPNPSSDESHLEQLILSATDGQPLESSEDTMEEYLTTGNFFMAPEESE